MNSAYKLQKYIRKTHVLIQNGGNFPIWYNRFEENLKFVIEFMNNEFEDGWCFTGSCAIVYMLSQLNNPESKNFMLNMGQPCDYDILVNKFNDINGTNNFIRIQKTFNKSSSYINLKKSIKLDVTVIENNLEIMVINNVPICELKLMSEEYESNKNLLNRNLQLEEYKIQILKYIGTNIDILNILYKPFQSKNYKGSQNDNPDTSLRNNDPGTPPRNDDFRTPTRNDDFRTPTRNGF